jgi:hypothetical protein
MVQYHIHNSSPPLDPALDEPNQTLITYFHNTVLSSHLCSDLPNGFFLSDPLTKILQTHLISTMDTARPPHLFLTLLQSTNYQAPLYATFSTNLLLPLSYIQTFSSTSLLKPFQYVFFPYGISTSFTTICILLIHKPHINTTYIYCLLNPINSFLFN